MLTGIKIRGIMTWLKECEICSAGLCKSVDERKSQGKNEHTVCNEMSEESNGLYSGKQILDRYRYHTGKDKKVSEFPKEKATEFTENEILKKAVKIKKERYKKKLEKMEEERQEIIDHWESMPARPGSPAQREKQVFYKKETDICIVCLALAPDEDHPYLETAIFELSQEDYESVILKDTKPAECFDIVFQLHNEKKIVCTTRGTWGNCMNPKADPCCRNHFIHYSNGKKTGWWKNGFEHGLPEKAFKTDLRIIDQDPRTPEQKIQQRIESYNRDIEGHHKEIERLERNKVRIKEKGVPPQTTRCGGLSHLTQNKVIDGKIELCMSQN